MEFKESGLKFTFDEAHWQVIQFDIDANYRKLADVVRETKAIDFLGVYQTNRLVLFEIKSFRHHRIENKPRLEAGAEELTTEIAQKVRDSLASTIGARRNSVNDEAFWETVAKLFVHPKREILVVSWVEEDGQSVYRLKLQKQKTSVEISKLKSKLKWLTPRVNIENVKNCQLNLEGFSCEFIKGS